MPEQPDELRILVHESRRADFVRGLTRRQALVAGAGTALAAYLAACGGKTAQSGGGGGGGSGAQESKPPTPANGKVEQGNLLVSNWVDYSDPNNYKGYTAKEGPKIKVSG